jgi:hypothetical protein
MLAVVMAVPATAYALTLAPGITWANNGADSGDLVAAAAVLGVGHPSGYPTYLLLGYLFQLLPLGELAFRVNLLSLVAALLSVVVVYVITRQLTARSSWFLAAASAIAALSFALSPIFWSQAVIAEVHTLNALFSGLMLLCILRLCDRASSWAWFDPYQGLLVGVALGNHLTIGLLALVWLSTIGWYACRIKRPGLILRQLAWVGVGLLVYLYLPLSAIMHPPINWGDPHDLDGFWWTISGHPYRDLAFGLPPEQLAGRVQAWAALLIQQYGLVGTALGFLGLLYGAPAQRLFLWLTAIVAVAASVFAATYNTIDSDAYLIPVYLIFAIWIALGIGVLLDRIASWAAAVPFAVVGLVALLAWPFASNFAMVDASKDDRAAVFANAVLAAAPARAIVLTSSDRDTFALWYYHYALRQRPDIAVVVEPLLDFPWYRENLRFVYPQLRFPDASDGSWYESIANANGDPERVCQTELSNVSPIECGDSRGT